MKRIKVLEFRRMIAQLAYRTWKTLPHQHQIWISIDDLIEDGMFCAYQIATGKWYDRSKSALSTTIYHAVKNHLQNEYVIRYGNEKRFNSLESANLKKRDRKGYTPAGIVSLDAWATLGGEPAEPPQLSVSEATIYDNVLTDCFVVPTLAKIYHEATYKLREQMVIWFLQNKEKVHLKSPKFRQAAKEFRHLSREYDLTYYDCEHLIRSPRCMNALSHKLLSVPYDMEHPTPISDKEL